MTASLLEQLAPDHAPPPLGWWPLAPGWWGLMGLLLLALVLVMWWRKRRQRPSVKRWQRAALRELAQLQSASGQAASDDARVARGVQQLLRRYAIARYGRETVATLSGDTWIAFVVSHGGSDWAGDSGHALLRCAYGGAGANQDLPAAPAQRERWLNGARAFVKGVRAVR